jgi:sigma-B regulation protein RsbU (phosphoserine phosphatase)
MFVTLFAGILDIKTGYLEYANAGHNPTIYVPASGSLQLLKNISGPVVGAMEELEYQTFSLQLAPTDLLFLYTDGVTEGMNPDKELYGEKRLMQIITLNAHRLLSHELIQVVCDDLKQFVGQADQSDDITMMALRWHGKK